MLLCYILPRPFFGIKAEPPAPAAPSPQIVPNSRPEANAVFSFSCQSGDGAIRIVSATLTISFPPLRHQLEVEWNCGQFEAGVA
jgi:hypothetical protein